LYQLAESRNSSTDRSVDIFPVTKEFLIRQACFLGDAINKFDHSHLRGSKSATPRYEMPLSYRLNFRVYHLTMSRIHPECPGSDPSDRSIAADVLLRQEPDEDEEEEEEDEGEDNGKEEDDDDDTTDDGYSE